MDKDAVLISIGLLEDWLQKQTHFVRKSYSRDYLERTLVSCKFSVERAKERIDKMCTYRTLMPEFFHFNDVKTDLADFRGYLSTAYLPMLAPGQVRLFLGRIENDSFKPSYVLQLFKYFTLMGEFMRQVEYCSAFRIILDFRPVNILNMVTKCNPVEVKKILTIITEGFGMRLKGIDFISESKLVDSAVSLFKQVLNAKLGGRIRVYNNLEELYEVVPKEILPVEYGGTEKPLRVLFDEWFDVLTSEEHYKYFKEMTEAKTVESYRLHSNFNESYMGTPGSFRAMKID